jgi:hypothetical protein
MPLTSTIKYTDLESALEWSSSSESFENTAVISRQTGEIHFLSESGDFGIDTPDDIDDETLYAAMPDKNELDLGQDVVFAFVQSATPQHQSAVRSYFKQRGAYSKFKSLLERDALLEQWYTYERVATREALLKWAATQGFNVIEVPSAA